MFTGYQETHTGKDCDAERQGKYKGKKHCDTCLAVYHNKVVETNHLASQGHKIATETFSLASQRATGPRRTVPKPMAPTTAELQPAMRLSLKDTIPQRETR